MQGPKCLHKLSLESYLVVGHLGRRKIKHDSTTWVIGLSIIMAIIRLGTHLETLPISCCSWDGFGWGAYQVCYQVSN